MIIKDSKKIFEKFPNIKSIIFFTTITCSFFLCLNLSAGNDCKHKIGDKKEFWTWDLNVMCPETTVRR